VPSLPYFGTGGLCNSFQNYRNVFNAAVPPSGTACVGSEEGGSQVMRSTENFFMLCFVCSQLGSGQGNTSPCLGSNVMSPWGIQCCTKVSFKNKLLFSRFYMFLNFTCIINDPFRKLKSGFYCVSLLASFLEEGWIKDL
jgi:hypothetical protein